jgi:hypothetical protein
VPIVGSGGALSLTALPGRERAAATPWLPGRAPLHLAGGNHGEHLLRERRRADSLATLPGRVWTVESSSFAGSCGEVAPRPIISLFPSPNPLYALPPSIGHGARLPGQAPLQAHGLRQAPSPAWSSGTRISGQGTPPGAGLDELLFMQGSAPALAPRGAVGCGNGEKRRRRRGDLPSSLLQEH